MKFNVSTKNEIIFKNVLNPTYNLLIRNWQNIKYVAKTGLPKEFNQGEHLYIQKLYFKLSLVDNPFSNEYY